MGGTGDGAAGRGARVRGGGRWRGSGGDGGRRPCGAGASGRRAGGGGRRVRRRAWRAAAASASDAPQNLQNWAAESTTPRHRLHTRGPSARGARRALAEVDHAHRRNRRRLLRASSRAAGAFCASAVAANGAGARRDGRGLRGRGRDGRGLDQPRSRRGARRAEARPAPARACFRTTCSSGGSARSASRRPDSGARLPRRAAAAARERSARGGAAAAAAGGTPPANGEMPAPSEVARRDGAASGRPVVASQADRRRGRGDSRAEPLTALLAERQVRRVLASARRAVHDAPEWDNTAARPSSMVTAHRFDELPSV